MSAAAADTDGESQHQIELRPLPNGWCWSAIGAAAAPIRNAIVDGPFGSNLKLSDYADDGTVPVLTTKNIDGHFDGVRYVTEQKFEELRRSAVVPHDILMAKIGSCGKVGIYPADAPTALIPANLLKMTVNRLFHLHYVYYYFNSVTFQRHLKTIIKATAQPAFGVTNFKRLPLPVAPAKEQVRIVSKIEELFSEIEEGERALERVQKLVERYRQSVLKAAVTGELTREWREKHKGPLESGEALLQRILKARREAWERAAPVKMTGKAQSPAISADTTNLPDLPSGWVWASMDQVGLVSGGLTKNQKRGEHALQRPYLRVANVYTNRLELGDVQEIGVSESELDRVLLQTDDLLVVEGNGSIDQIGRVALWDGSIPDCVHQNHIIKVRSCGLLPSWYLLVWCMSPLGREQIRRVASSTAGLHTLSISKVQALPVPVPPAAELSIIKDAFERMDSRVHAQRVAISAENKRAGALRQAVLRQAFVGALVSQDPTDEPASTLLAHISTEPPPTPVRRRS